MAFLAVMSTENYAVGSFIYIYIILQLQGYTVKSVVLNSHAMKLKRFQETTCLMLLAKYYAVMLTKSQVLLFFVRTPAIWYGCHPLMLTHSQTRMLCKVDFHKYAALEPHVFSVLSRISDRSFNCGAYSPCYIIKSTLEMLIKWSLKHNCMQLCV